MPAKILLRFLSLCAVVLALSGGLARGADPDDLRQLVVSLDKPSALGKAATVGLAKALSMASPRLKLAPRSLVTKDGRFILYGDLFKTGGCFAVYEIKSGEQQDYNDGASAMAEWIKGKWQLRGLWKIATVWRPKGWESKGDDYLPATPATQPFELSDLSGDGVPELIVAGEVEKYFQASYLLRFDPKTHGLVLLKWAMRKPVQAGKYVRLYLNYGRRAIYEEWLYFAWSGGRLIQRASWYDESPYNNDDPAFVRAEVNGDHGAARKFKIEFGESDSERESVYKITEDKRPYAKVVFRRKPGDKPPVDGGNGLEYAWLFEKVTGLPRTLYPGNDSPKNGARIEDYATVRVTGSKDALQRLGTAWRLGSIFGR